MVNFKNITTRYKQRVINCLDMLDHPNIIKLADRLVECIKSDQRLFVCGNGGSGSNASHIENDFLYGISKMIGKGIKCQSLSANPAVITCLANDEGYDNIFRYQLALEANKDDVLLVLSGSGNSPNILRVLEQANEMGIDSFALLGFSGGQAKALVKYPIHFEINDMQVAEDMHMIVAHIISQWIYENKNNIF